MSPGDGLKVQVNCGGRPTTINGVREVVIDGCRFTPESLLSLARSAGELFSAERTGDTVTLHVIRAMVGSESRRLLVQGRPRK